MSFEREIFKRATIRGVADYLLFGHGPDEGSMNYEQRLEATFLKYEKLVLQTVHNENSELIDSANEVSSETASVYTEIGLQAGFLIMMDMMKNMGLSQDMFEKKSKMVDYQVMYGALSREITAALNLLQEGGDETLKGAVSILKEAQGKTEKIYMDKEP